MAAGGTLSSIFRLQVQWARQGGDDVGVTTHDFRQLDTVWPDDGTGGALHNFATMEADFLTFWGAIKANFKPGTYPAEFRWYRNDAPVPDWGEPARTVIPTAVPGTDGTREQLPHQCACSVTERVDSRRHWGRFYLPAPSDVSLGSTGSSTGRFSSSFVTATATAAQAMYNAWNTRGVRCVVLGSVKTDYNLALLVPTSWIGEEFGRWIAKGTTEPRLLIAYDVKTVRVDDIVDIIRRRRVGTPLTRIDRTVT